MRLKSYLSLMTVVVLITLGTAPSAWSKNKFQKEVDKDTAGKSQADYAALPGADKDRPIVGYCGFVKCTRSHNGAAWAKKLGYTHVYRYSGGIFAWKGAGYEVAIVK